MKSKIVKKFLFFFLLISVFFSCSNITEDASDESSTQKNTIKALVSGGSYVKFESKSSVQNDGSKSIIPATVNQNSLYFYFWGTDLIDKKDVEVQKVDIYSSKGYSNSGNFTISLSNSYYQFILAATPSEISLTGTNAENILAIKKAAYFSGSASVDLRYAESICFVLSPHNVSGTGKVRLNLSTSDWTPSGYEIIAGIHNLSDNSLIYDSSGYNPELLLSSSKLAAGTETFDWDGITAGSYNFIVSFKGESRTFYWSDVLEIFANQTTSANISIGKVVSEKPENPPTNLIAAYYDLDSESEADYYAEFCWDDNSCNEDYFQLELLDVTNLDYGIVGTDSNYNSNVKVLCDSSASDSDKETAWTNLRGLGVNTSVEVYNKDNYGDPSVTNFSDKAVDGSLMVNHNYIVYRVPLDSRYFARICACNDIGKTSYTYLNLSNSNNRTIETTTLGKTFKSFDSNSTAINRYRLVYKYLGGKYYDDADSSSVVSVGQRYFYTQLASDADQPAIINPINYVYSGANTATLKCKDENWSEWRINSTSGEKINSETGFDYSGFEGMFLYAYYNGIEADTTVITTEDTSVTGDADIQVFGNSTESNYVDYTGFKNRINISDGYFTVKRAEKPYLVFLLKYGGRFDACYLEIQKPYGTKTIQSTTQSQFDTKCYDMLVNISDSTEFVKDTLYVARFVITPISDSENLKYKSIRFLIED